MLQTIKSVGRGGDLPVSLTQESRKSVVGVPKERLDLFLIGEASEFPRSAPPPPVGVSLFGRGEGRPIVIAQGHGDANPGDGKGDSADSAGSADSPSGGDAPGPAGGNDGKAGKSGKDGKAGLHVEHESKTTVDFNFGGCTNADAASRDSSRDQSVNDQGRP